MKILGIVTVALMLMASNGVLGAPEGQRPNLVIADFEGRTYGAWKATGTAFGSGPAYGTLDAQQQVVGFIGIGLVNTFQGGDVSVGALTSPPFKIQRRRIAFLIGGGHHPATECLNLWVAGKIVRTTTGRDAEQLFPEAWDVSDLQGQTAVLQIVDTETGGWGHINVDEILQTDQIGLLEEQKPPAGVSFVNVRLANPTPYHELYRPQFHFTTYQGWNNDPNGLVYFQNTWHFFFQHMAWGHATSTDLVHWVQKPNAVDNDVLGAAFSGSAVVDWQDSSGFFGGKPGLVLIYSQHDGTQGNRELMSIAYSPDGAHFTKYAHNPVIPQLRYVPGQGDEADFRDPKVFWYEPTKRWIMVTGGGKIRLWSSPNLREWTFESIHPEIVSECPDFFPLDLDGKPKAQKWILSCGGPHYYVGSFDGHVFTPESPALRLNGPDFYAMQTWSDVPDGRRIMISWMPRIVDGPSPTQPWSGGQMSIPVTLSLRSTPTGPRLFQTPVKELQVLRGHPVTRTYLALSGGKPVPIPEIKSHLLEIVAEFDPGTARQVGFNILKGADGQQTVVGYDTGAHTLFVDRSHSGEQPNSPAFDPQIVVETEMKNGLVGLHLFVDASSVELFTADGSHGITCGVYPGADAKGVEVFAKNGQAHLKSLTIYPLASIWKHGSKSAPANNY